VWQIGRDSLHDIQTLWSVDDVVQALAFAEVEGAEVKA